MASEFELYLIREAGGEGLFFCVGFVCTYCTIIRGFFNLSSSLPPPEKNYQVIIIMVLSHISILEKNKKRSGLSPSSNNK